MRNPGDILRFLFSLFIAMCLGLPTAAAAHENSETALLQWNGDFAEGWVQYEKLIKDQKHEKASALLENLLQKAQAEKNSIEWTRCLVRKTTGLLYYSPEAIRILKKEPWPQDPEALSVISLVYARSLISYARNYSQGIDRRKKVDSTSVDDPALWTRDQFQAEALKALENAWKNRTRIEKLSDSPWKEFFIPNTYPEGIRSTPRDAVSYMMVQMMGDTMIWSSEQINGILNLNLKKLSGDAREQVSIADLGIHPLEKICFVLADLERRHRQKEEREAALEARLERYRYLHHYFKKLNDRTYIQNSLQEYLKPLADVPWWSEGMAQLARFTLTEDESGLIAWESYLRSEIDRNFAYGADPGKLARALQIALKGKEAFPDSIGGKRCLGIIKAIKDSDYSISAMRNDNAQQKSILVMHRNQEKIYFRAYAIDLLKTIEKYCATELAESADRAEEHRPSIIGDYSDDLLEYEWETIITDRMPDHQWDVALPSTPDNRMHRTFVVPPMTRPGAYLIIASARADFSDEGSYERRSRSVFLTISDLALITRRWGNSYEVTVLRGSNGKPVAGAEVMLYGFDYEKRRSHMDSRVSNESGKATFHGEKDKVGYFLVVRAGGDITYDSQRLYFYQPEKQPEYSVLFFLDKTIHRPNEKLFWKAVLYQKTSSRFSYRTCPEITFTVSLKGKNDQVLESKTVTSNSYGTASGEFTIPSGSASEGLYLVSPGSPLLSNFPITVKECKGPIFETKILDSEKPLRMNQPIRIKGVAKYSSGLPVKKGRVQWMVRRTNASPISWEIARGVEPLKKDGAYSFAFLPEADKGALGDREIYYSYAVTANVTDENGEARSVERSFQLGPTSVRAEAIRDKEVFLENDPILMTVRRIDLYGVPRKGKGRWRIVRLEQPAKTLLPAEQPIPLPEELARKEYRTPGDLEMARWKYNYNPYAAMSQWKDGPTQASGSISHDEKGEATISTPALPSGAYRLIYETVDNFGAKFELREAFVVATPAMSLHLPAMLALEKPVVKPGDTARILAHSGIQDQFMILEIYRGWECILRKEMLSGKDPSLIEFPITEEDCGGLNVVLTLVRDHQFIRLQKNITVPHDNKRLKVDLSTFRDRLRTGDREKWSVKVTGPEGKNAAVPEAELLAYMYDRNYDAVMSRFPWGPIHDYPWIGPEILAIPNLGEAVDIQWHPSHWGRDPDGPSLKSDRLIVGYMPLQQKNPDAFDRDVATMDYLNKVYPGITSGSGIGQDGISVEIPQNRSGYYGRELFPERSRYSDSVSISYEEESKPVASEGFSETALWKPHLVTDENGAASFEFDVPDSVTSWNVLILAITRDFKFGSVHHMVRSEKGTAPK